MDTSKKAESAHLLDDLESIRQLLGNDSLQPPLLTETVNAENRNQIPLLHDLLHGMPQPIEAPQAAAMPRETLRFASASAGADSGQDLESELRAAAHLIMQEVIDDFAPHIENEIKRRLEARMERLIAAASGKR